jgi:O-acetylserine/cysteine efflux transporter
MPLDSLCRRRSGRVFRTRTGIANPWQTMKPVHIALAVLVAVVWGIAFVVSKIGLESFTPSQLTALRFMVAGIAAIWLPRPSISWKSLVFVGLTVFTGQFLLQFFGLANGMPAGLTAVVVQTQALFTVLFAAFTIGDKPSPQHVIGMLTAGIGLLLIGMTLGGDVTAIGFMLTLGSAVSWAIGNVFVKRLPKVDTLHLMVWASLVPPLPALAISCILDRPKSLWPAFVGASWSGIAAVIYLGLAATVVAYAMWGRLLQRYPTGAVAPFALLSPCVGAITSAAVFGERFGPLRLGGIALMLIGVAIVALPRYRLGLSRSRTR